ncbi:leucine--tRNA ligase [Criblamydia sequanensis]|uniref:Leucine--tRNA ligase n=1 Tax=Candidatus Criblamydia sequanensis CRIB-18 TaxID=1437425 RepID=A0A090D103_9BACT|nr:leucine--tRNA ligase [Criblamydia sequanensis]CDR35051.1 Leucyl-tRNA synthetase [Criblamydia sequanensis CRIB-18]
MKYNHKAIESKWQKNWEENKAFKVEADRSKPKYYVLDMFPYPSGSGLHVGHVEGYTATDIIARFKRQKGFNVLHPMGWDSFGLPAEQYAVRTGTHPQETTKKNIDTFRKQLKSLGFSYDWDRELATSDPKYYKWTQWIFTKLYEKGLAYEAEMLVNYCPALGTVLANEEVEDGKAKEGGHPVERKPLKQWVLKITEYAEKLLDDLSLLDWPEGLKKLQVNWIGKSLGAKVLFPIENRNETIEVFTTRADTLFGATFLVLSPEHPFLETLTHEQSKAEVQEYQKQASKKSDLARTDLAKDKSGVFIGTYAINPLNGRKIPIWVSDYVLMGYGTGAIMAVPGHDERDFEFARKFNLPILPIIEPDFETYSQLIPIGMEKEEVLEEVLKGKRCWTGEGRYIYSKNEDLDLSNLSMEEAKSAVAKYLEKKNAGKETTCYKLRDWLFSRQRYWGEPFPILHFEDGTKRVLDLDELPLLPPDIQDFRPAGDGRSPLAKVTDWVDIQDKKEGKAAKRETNTMPQWAGSCWYYLRFLDPQNEKRAWDADKENYWMPVDLYVGGVEHAVLHLLYARFWHKVLYDLGLVSTKEPFQQLRNQGLIVARSYQNKDNLYVDPEEVMEKNGQYIERKSGEVLKSQIEKMSKSKLNGITPDDIIEEFGADSLRLYEMFMGPLDREKVWNTDAVSGCRRFLQRFYDMATSDKVTEDVNEEALRLGHRLVHQVTNDIEALQFNTAIAKMMEFINEFTKLESYPKSIIKMATQCLMPFAPHLAEEIWETLGFKENLNAHPFPDVNPVYLTDALATYIVQVNGKVRGKFDLPKNRSEEEILKIAKENELISKHLGGKEIKKVIFVPNKLLNMVVD